MANVSDAASADAPRHGRRVLAFAYGLVLACVVVVLAAVTLFGRGPSARLDLPPPPVRQAAVSRAPAMSTATPASQPVGTPISKPLYAGRALLADPALIQNTPMGPLPRIADDGRKPMSVYATPVPAGKLRIAIVIGGLGLSAEKTQAALKGLPSAVTVAFAPYQNDVEHWVGTARQLGHEVLLEVPMEPFDFPDSDPGPHTLRSGLGEEANTQRLTWALTRITGYVGITNLMGGRLLCDPTSLSPVMTFLTRRGLLFFDDGTIAQSAAPDVAARIGAPFAQANERIDAVPSAPEVDRHLSDLEAQARATGRAIGSGRLYPVTIQRVADWAKGLAGRGFVLVPISAMMDAPKK
jgi:polysaccharide deacetylase 2 family uncharacterized protein YibQ